MYSVIPCHRRGDAGTAKPTLFTPFSAAAAPRYFNHDQSALAPRPLAQFSGFLLGQLRGLWSISGGQEEKERASGSREVEFASGKQPSS